MMNRIWLNRTATRCIAAVLLGCVWVNLSSQAIAQQAQANSPAADLLPRFDSLRPYEFEKETPEATVPEKPEQPKKPDEDEELLDSLDGIYFTSHADGILKEGREGVKGVEIVDIPLLENEEFRSRIEPFVGEPVSIAQLRQLVRTVIQYYRDQDIPVVDVIVAEQDITVGVVQLHVVEGRLEDVIVEGNKWFSDELISSKIRMKRAERILSTPLIEDINYLNRNPFRRVKVVFEKGDQAGYTDLILETEDRFPVRIYTGYEDTGNDLTGEERLLFGANWGNAFMQDHTLSYQYTASTDFNTQESHSIFYSMPVRRHDTWTSFFSISIADDAELDRSTTGGLLQILNGETVQAGMDYRFGLPSPGKDFYHGITPGFTYKKVYNKLEQVTPFVLQRKEHVEVLHWSLKYDAFMRDPVGYTRFETTAFHSFGNWTSLNGADEFDTTTGLDGGRTGADPQYSYLKLYLERVFILPWEFEAHGRLTWQFSDSNLLATEQLGIGGFNTVRGYTEAEVRGDEGYYFNLEMRTPKFSVTRIFGVQDPKDRIQLLGFWDYGQGRNKRLIAMENDGTELSALGVGVRASYGEYLSLRADYGFQMVDTRLNNRFNSRLHLGLILAY
ncbi:MAG: ShlB/FhaC/HecB family hemolysin secretion/activation protein [Verrucomicrobiota bacterium]